ncbi:SMI1/KNR4 family protein [Massilia sp. BJB1822]|uniref:SMI1/KNR4 family protein n=1 Tax=Massilia sp. BJB1822 TaxID=2744470 RepID=UPI001594AC33|nr:SMI1/KNR4 family protein [Massilia sp. BJB1822]NVE01761.1 SMI1/KNR4 family protein [Massilia sp. BJB1822]
MLHKWLLSPLGKARIGMSQLLIASSTVPPKVYIAMDAFKRLLKRMEHSRVASSQNVLGCTEQEVIAIEKKYKLRLPQVYRRYLETMGHRSGRLFAFDHVAAFYSAVLNLTADAPNDWSEDGLDPPSDFLLPRNHLLISERLGDQFEFICCNGDNESPVWYFNTWDWEIRLQHQSVQEWLECWCTQSEDAIASGYFSQHPDGITNPIRTALIEGEDSGDPESFNIDDFKKKMVNSHG